VWVWVGAFVLALCISQPLQWKQLNAADHSYFILQVHPYDAWPVKEPFGSFTGAALTRNLSGLIEAADLKEFWFVPVHLQIARRLADQSLEFPFGVCPRFGELTDRGWRTTRLTFSTDRKSVCSGSLALLLRHSGVDGRLHSFTGFYLKSAIG
jgi:hypothetical protein